MLLFDAHCDTLTKAVDTQSGLSDNTLHWDISRARRYDGFVQVLAVWQDPIKGRPTFKKAMDYIREAENFQIRDPHLKLCKNITEIEEGLKEKKVCGLLAIEGGECLEGRIENLQTLYQAGVRLMTLTWNHANELGDGAEAPENRGLTPFGRSVVSWMQQNGMLVDISHAGERTFWDCIDISHRPVIASHSNARTVHDHPRNLRDDQLRAIAKTHGVIGINFYTRFIGPSGKDDLDALIAHIEHIAGIAGEDAIGLGADFDGMMSLPAPMEGVQSLNILLDALSRRNIPASTLEKFAGSNFLRVIRNVLGQTGE